MNHYNPRAVRHTACRLVIALLLWHSLPWLTTHVCSTCMASTPMAASTGIGQSDQGYSLSCGATTLLLKAQADGTYALSVQAGNETYSQPDGCAADIEVFATMTNKEEGTHCRAPYQQVSIQDQQLVCQATVVSPKGSEFAFTDTYTEAPERQCIRLERRVRVKKKGSGDVAFNSYLVLVPTEGGNTAAFEYLLPSILYKDAENLPPHAIGADLTDPWILAREERLPTPMAMMQRKATGTTLSVADCNQRPTTTVSDWGINHLSDANFRFASLGYCMALGTPALAYCYPGNEEAHTYNDGGGTEARRWSRRSHAVSTTTQHQYVLELHASEESGFAEAVAHHWWTAVSLQQPQVLPLDNDAVQRYAIQVLDRYWLRSGDAAGFPFSVWTRTGQVNETSFDMGFVGMQVPCAYYLLRQGIEKADETLRVKGEQILDFWTRRAHLPDGMPLIWYDIAPYNSFRNYNDLRNMQGGLEAIVQAWSVAERHRPGSKPMWLGYCKNAANWLVSRQASDGSLAKAYDNAGKVVDAGTFLTSNVIRFLGQMYALTRDTRYRTAAVKAGNFCLKQLHQPYKYIGSVIDNPYVKDRESGQKMLEAALALYDMTADDKWLDMAQQAAIYTATYMYTWNIPAENGSQQMPWTSDKSTVGITIIATGHSGADCGLAYNAFEYMRLYVITGDERYLLLAQLMQNNTKQTMNYDGKLGYPLRGLQTEALRLVTHRGDGVNLWLPWVTATTLDPMYRLMDAYGSIDIATLAAQPRQQLLEADRRYAKTQGL